MAKRIAITKQSPKSLIGCCFGYSSFWAKGKLDLPKPDPTKIYEIPLTDEIVYEQLTQFSPSEMQRLPKFYVDYWDKKEFISDIKQGLKNANDAVIIGYHGLIGGHALAVKKISDNTYQFFDCNLGAFEINDEELDNLFHYIHPTYQKVFYGFNLEYVPANTADLSQNYALENGLATAYLLICKFICMPVGLIRYLQSVVEYIVEKLGTLLESSEMSERSSLISSSV